ncbi:MAG: LytTR family DNA-binding domain-containing protein [Melioribacteraceae bacterium]|nr:LytTR family DNA-binding domain-containing protein [Melioribacteraceae bacterium]MCF8356003.1 LytTR family DNA-binding domain-containing protein [Melioribacteraceae bacterium]MCF8394686.1 LytTR family DNA-binding domain-containing protein [Melioribacteraceae bacterium]MCF8420236.1 LytTR family DNA-binding domain-containing protein [Melioribacteraceae bacterium]
MKAIIVDDELHGRENLRAIIESYCPEIEILGLADSVLTARKLVEIHKPDVVFLDISMPVLDGFDFLNEFDERNFMVVFVSAHEEFGIKAVKAGAVDYLLKPINIKELKQTIKKLLVLINKKVEVESSSESDKLMLPASHGFEVLLTDNIIRLEAEGCYTKVILIDGKNKIVSRTLKDFENTLSDKFFFRTHKSHLINLKHIKDYSKLSGGYATMIDGSKVEISRRKAPEFLNKIKSFLNTI